MDNGEAIRQDWGVFLIAICWQVWCARDICMFLGCFRFNLGARISAWLSLNTVLLSPSSSLGVVSERSGSVWDPSMFWVWSASSTALFSVSKSDLGLLFGFIPLLLDMITLPPCRLLMGIRGLVVARDVLGVGICCSSQPLDFLASGGPVLLVLVLGIVVSGDGGGIEVHGWGALSFLLSIRVWSIGCG